MKSSFKICARCTRPIDTHAVVAGARESASMPGLHKTCAAVVRVNERAHSDRALIAAHRAAERRAALRGFAVANVDLADDELELAPPAGTPLARRRQLPIRTEKEIPMRTATKKAPRPVVATRDPVDVVTEYERLGDEIDRLEARRRLLRPTLESYAATAPDGRVTIGDYVVAVVECSSERFDLKRAREHFDWRKLKPFVKVSSYARLTVKPIEGGEDAEEGEE